MMDQIADAELVAQALGGNKEAFGQLVERHQQMVERIAKKMVTDEWIAHELAQEAILQAYLSLNHLRDASRFKSWLYGKRSIFAEAIFKIRSWMYFRWKPSWGVCIAISSATLTIRSIRKLLRRRMIFIGL